MFPEKSLLFRMTTCTNSNKIISYIGSTVSNWFNMMTCNFTTTRLFANSTFPLISFIDRLSKYIPLETRKTWISSFYSTFPKMGFITRQFRANLPSSFDRMLKYTRLSFTPSGIRQLYSLIPRNLPFVRCTKFFYGFFSSFFAKVIRFGIWTGSFKNKNFGLVVFYVSSFPSSTIEGIKGIITTTQTMYYNFIHRDNYNTDAYAWRTIY